MRVDLPRGRIEDVEISREASSAPAGTLLREKYRRLVDVPATLRAD